MDRDGTAGASTTSTSTSNHVAAIVPASGVPGVNWQQLAEQQGTWEGLAALRASSSLKICEVQVEEAKVYCVCDYFKGVLRPIIPPSHRHQIFQHVHGLAHAGIRATCRLISARYVWPGLAAEVKEWCKQCVECCRAKVTT